MGESADSFRSRSGGRSGARVRATALGGDMTRLHAQRTLPILFLPFILVAASAAASPDLRLLSLVPPGAQLVAGISASTIQGQPHNFVLLTPINWVDLQDFFALTGADDS